MIVISQSLRDLPPTPLIILISHVISVIIVIFIIVISQSLQGLPPTPVIILFIVTVYLKPLCITFNMPSQSSQFCKHPIGITLMT